MHKHAFAVLLSGFLGLCAFMGVRSATTTAQAVQSREHPLTRQELMAREGIMGRAGMVRDAIARVASGDPAAYNAVAQIAEAWAALRHDEEELSRLARTDRHLPDSVSLIQSGVAWVETASR